MNTDKLKVALQKHEWTEADIERLCEGNFLAQVLKVMRGQAEITTAKKEKEKETMAIALPTTLNCTKPLDPVAFLGQGWNVWKGPSDGDGLSGEEEIDPRSLALTTLDPTKLLLETCLKEKEKVITGEEKLKRFKEKSNVPAHAGLIRLGGNVFLALWEDYQTNKENSILEWLYRNKKITYLDFFGLILRYPLGHRYVFYLCRGVVGEWRWYYYWLDLDWGASRLSASLASLPAESSVKAG